MLDENQWSTLINKKGNETYIGDLKTLAKESIDKQEFSETENDYVIQCPYCVDAYKHDHSYNGPYLKRKLYVTKDFRVGQCFRCHKVFIDSDDTIHYDFNTPEPPLSMVDFELEKLNGKQWNLELFNQFDEYDELGYNYLVTKRHKYMKDLWKQLHIRFSNHNPVIPFYFRGELIYYQIKMAFGNSKIPYFTPPISHKPAYVIERGENKRFVISEGTFDSIANLINFPDRTPMSLLGSTITEYQITMLRQYVPDDILVYMDDTELSKKVADKISRYISYAEIHIKPSDGTDPEEWLKDKILKGFI